MLWVITQNQNSLMKVKEVTVKGKYIEGVVGRSFFNEWSKTLGKYESSERAKKVLKEIYSKIGEGKSNCVTYTMPEK